MFNKIIKTIITFAILLLVFSVAYFFVLYLPEKEIIKKEQLELELEIETGKRAREELEILSESQKNETFQNKKTCLDFESKLFLEHKHDDLKEVFYSPKLNTCIFVYWTYESAGERYVTRHVIKDIFIKKYIFYDTNVPEWEKKVKELKED